MRLLIHSMAELSALIMPMLEIAGCNSAVEIGAEGGGMTERLLEFVTAKGGWMTSIDPAPSELVLQRLSGTPYGALYRDISLRALPRIPPADVYLIDGDHNYFTVAQELLLIEALQGLDNKPFFAILHDVCWPWAYRDLYYDPERIPAEWRQPLTWERGVTLDNPGTIEGGFRGCGAWACAQQEGGPANGVTKAVEDFIRTREEKLRFAIIPAVFGLGIVYSAAAPWVEDLERHLAPYNRNPLLATLEQNRLANYLRVIHLQDTRNNTPVKEPTHAG